MASVEVASALPGGRTPRCPFTAAATLYDRPMNRLGRIGCAALAAALIVGCGADDGGDDEGAAPTPVTTEAEAASATSEVEQSVAGDEPSAPEGGSENAPGGDVNAIDIDPSWEPTGEPHFVYGVDEDDTLNVRAEPGVDGEILGTLAPNATGIDVFVPVEWIGESRWAPIGFGDGAGWVNLAFLRPEPSTSTPAIEGVADEALLDAVADTLVALGARTAPPDLESLSVLVGLDGLTLSPETFVADDSVVLTNADLVEPGSGDLEWGSEPGTGDPIVMSIQEFIDQLAGSPALTSTEVVGYDVTVGSGTTINNLADRFPGAAVVEYHYEGTAFYGGLDWASVRFVYDVTFPNPVLLAIVQDAWAP